MELNPSIKDFLETAVYNLQVENHPYFKALLSGKISKQEFINDQIEFSHMVEFFNRPMALVISNIPHATKRMAIVDNLWEEHGKGVPENIHGRTILTLIDRLGGDSASITEKSVTTNVRLFNQSLRGAAAFEDYRFSTAMFGGIERTFVEISSLICRGITENGWLPEDKITHYALHKELDILHAEDFLKVSNDDWDNSEQQQNIKEGIKFGANMFLNVYSGFYNDLKI